jgi:hypothetical protein
VPPTTPGLTEGDEAPHAPGRGHLWAESWDFDFATVDGSLGGYVRLGLFPNLGVAWFWAALAGPGRPLVAVRDHDVPLPRRATTEVRAEGLWTAFTCESPYEHWSVGLEAFAVALDDPVEALAGERGDRIAFGLDLEWEGSAGPFDAGSVSGARTAGRRYEQVCDVYGEVLVNDERLELSGSGHRHHAWGVVDWWSAPRWRASGRLPDGRGFAAWGSGTPAGVGSGFVAAAGGSFPAAPVAIETAMGPGGLPVSASLTVDGLALGVTPVAHAPVAVEAPDGRRSRLARALCRFDSADGGAGVGWAEWLSPPAG